jgi:glyoxylase-like metal-dependent hydrolase (beta-lactamase superfamily II)
VSGPSEVTPVEGADIVRVRADNPGMLTLSGTNTWVIGRDPAWIVDPGPNLAQHLDAITAVCAERGGAGGIAVTHTHADHVEGVEALRERLGGVGVGPGPLEVVPVPGHAHDHVTFVWGDVCCTGDAVLGEGSVFVAGDMAGYLDGLAALRDRDDPPLRTLCPGHGSPVFDAHAKLAGYIAHRLDRERRLLEALAAGLRSEDELVDEAWSDAPAQLRPASVLTMRAHLRKLDAEGRLPAGMAVSGSPSDLPAI